MDYVIKTNYICENKDKIFNSFYLYESKKYLVGLSKFRLFKNKTQSRLYHITETHQHNYEIVNDGLLVNNNINEKTIVFEIPIQDSVLPLYIDINGGLTINPILNIDNTKNCKTIYEIYYTRYPLNYKIVIPVIFKERDIILYDGNNISSNKLTIPNTELLQKIYEEIFKECKIKNTELEKELKKYNNIFNCIINKKETPDDY